MEYNQFLPKDQYIFSEAQLMDQMCALLGGKAAESLVFERTYTTAHDDLLKVTKFAYDQIITYGMNEAIGPLSFTSSGEKAYSEDTARMIDEEVRKMVNLAYERTKNLLKGKRKELEKIAKLLLEKEVLTRDDMTTLLGARPFPFKQAFEELLKEEGSASN